MARARERASEREAINRCAKLRCEQDKLRIRRGVICSLFFIIPDTPRLHRIAGVLKRSSGSRERKSRALFGLTFPACVYHRAAARSLQRGRKTPQKMVPIWLIAPDVTARPPDEFLINIAPRGPKKSCVTQLVIATRCYTVTRAIIRLTVRPSSARHFHI